MKNTHHEQSFKIGDFVRFIDEKREGYITQIIDQDTFGVTDSDGFEIPVDKSNLTFVHGHYSNADSSNNAMPESEIDNTFIKEGVYLAIAEESKNSIIAQFNIVNTSSYQLLFTLNTEKSGILKGDFASIIQPKSCVEIYTANLGNIDNWPKFKFQFLFFTSTNQEGKEPLVVNKQFKAKDFSGAKKEVKELKRFAWLIQLDVPTIKIDAKQLKESFYSSKEQKHIVEKPNSEIDLHIEKLRDDYQFLSKHEILNIQLATFDQKLAAALVHKYQEITFIHGVGNGVLSHIIQKVLSKHPQVHTFMDARKEKFGYGATKVIFK